MRLSNWFGLRCWFKSCPGRIDHDKHSVFYRCSICGKIDRAPAIGDHWEPLDEMESAEETFTEIASMYWPTKQIEVVLAEMRAAGLKIVLSPDFSGL